MHFFKSILSAAVLCISAVGLNAATIGTFDSSRVNISSVALETGDSFDTLRSVLSGRGDTIKSVSTLSAANLADVDVFFTSLLLLNDTYTASELTALNDWVGAGGILFSAGEVEREAPFDFSAAYNNLLVPFQIQVTGRPTDPNPTVTQLIGGNGIIDGPNGTVTAFNLLSSGVVSGTNLDIIARADTGEAVMGVKQIGAGQVVVLGDFNTFTDGRINLNTANLFTNVVDLAAPPAVPLPASLPLLALGLGTLAFWRKRRAA